MDEAYRLRHCCLLSYLACSPHQDKRESKTEAADLVASMLFGDLQGPKAGPLRWAIRKDFLLALWEWKSFVAVPWQATVLALMARRADEDFSDKKVSVLNV